MENLPPRPEWVRLFSATPRRDVEALARSLSETCVPRAAAAPRDGLMLLALQDLVRMEPFHLGEIPVAAVQVILTAPDGREVEGGAVAMDDDVGFVTALAVLDGVLAARLPGWRDAAALLRLGQAERLRIERERAVMLEKTRVDFALLSEAGDDAA